jgi:hypothetical protein
MNERKVGTIVHGKPQSGWWFLRVGPETSLEVYFLHASNIRSGNSCEIGMFVEFEVSPVIRGKKPLAINADILGVEAVAQ